MLVIIVTLVLTALVALGITGMEIDSSITAVLPEDNPDFKYSELISEEFTSSEEIIISILSRPENISEEDYLKEVSSLPIDPEEIIASAGTLDNEPKWTLYSVPYIELISKITEKVLTLENVLVNGVNSIVTIANQYDQNQTTGFEEELTQNKVSWVKKQIEQNPMARGKIINKYHDNTVITVPIPNELSYSDTDLNNFLDSLIEELDTIFADYEGIRYELTGQPKVKADITKYIRNDVTFLLPIAILIVMFIIFFTTKSFKGTLIPLVVTILSVVWTFGLKGLLGWMGFDAGALTLTESVLPVVLISVACADGIHITNQALYFIDRGVPGKAAVYDAMQLVRLPVILAAITTAVGFGSLVFSPGRSLKNMGVFLAFGVIMAMVFSLILIPVLISYFKPQRFSQKKANSDNSNRFAFTRWMRPFITRVLKYRWIVMIITIALLSISLPASMKVKTDQDEVRFFKKDAPVRMATENIEKNLGGISTMYFIIEKAVPALEQQRDKPDSEKKEVELTNADYIVPRHLYKKNSIEWTAEDRKLIDNSLTQLRAQELIQKRAELCAPVSYTTSYASYFQLIDYLFKGKLQQKNFKMPRNNLRFYNTLRNFEQQEMIDDTITEKFVTENGEKLNTHIRIQDSNTSSMEQVVTSINDFAFLLYQLDPELKEDLTLLGKNPYHRSFKQRLKSEQFISSIDQAKKLAKVNGYRSVEQWYQNYSSFERFNSIKPASFGFSINQIIPDTEKTIYKLMENSDFRLIADHFEKRDLQVLTTSPIKFRWAGDYIRIINGSIIVQSQIISLAVATIIILILLTLIFRSPLTGILLTVPVIIAIFLNFTIMWIFKVSLNPATSIVASVGMGVGIDYSIHYYSRFRKLYQMTQDYNGSLVEAAVQSSSGIILNAIAVGVGFLVLFFSKYTIIQQMGLIVAFSMLTSGFGALTILPALLRIFKPKVSLKGMLI